MPQHAACLGSNGSVEVFFFFFLVFPFPRRERARSGHKRGEEGDYSLQSAQLSKKGEKEKKKHP